MANPRTIARLQERIKERAAHCLQFEVNDPRASFITVTRVELTHDFSYAKIFYSVLGGESDKSKAEHMLKSAGGFIQRQVARVLETRRVPHLHWIFDGSTEHAADMDRLIREARARDRAINPALGPENEFAKPREDQPAPEAPAEGADEPEDE
jgi:ribosome-binding factor A